MADLTFRTPIDVPAEVLFARHERPGAFRRLTPPWLPITLEHFERIRDGQRAVIRLGEGPYRVTEQDLAAHQTYGGPF